MNPGTILWQGPFAGLLLVVLAILGSPVASLALGAAALLVALALNAGYAQALGSRGRSARRIRGDNQVSMYVWVSVAPAVATAAGLAIADYEPRTTVWQLTHVETSVAIGIATVLLVFILLSSLIDWYYIRPRIDAVVCQPPCRADRGAKGQWKRVTRRWYIHRLVATSAYFGFALGEAIVVMVVLAEHDPTAAAVVGGVSGLAGIILIFAGDFRSSFPTVVRWATSPQFVLGDDLTYEGFGGRQRGYVLHVAVPVTKLVPLDENGHRTDVPWVERKNTMLALGDLNAKPAVACSGHRCAVLNPECLEEDCPDKTRLERDRRHIILWSRQAGRPPAVPAPSLDAQPGSAEDPSADTAGETPPAG